MIKTKCFADVSSTMNARDMEAIKRGVKERVDAGTVKLATIRTAEIGSVQDLLADIEGERAELMKLAREQHADVFAAPAAKTSVESPSAEAPPPKEEGRFDAAKAQELRNSIVEGEGILKSGRKIGRAHV